VIMMRTQAAHLHNSPSCIAEGAKNSARVQAVHIGSSRAVKGNTTRVLRPQAAHLRNTSSSGAIEGTKNTVWKIPDFHYCPEFGKVVSPIRPYCLTSRMTEFPLGLQQIPHLLLGQQTGSGRI
jgi:hypothetical protein